MRSIYSFIYSFFIYNMAQILKYSGGGTSPKPIKIGGKYYTKEQLMTDLYGDKLDEYIKFREFNSKEAANFRKNLDNQVNALIDGRLTLNGNTLIDSKGEWSNTGEYAKPKLFGKLNEEQIKNNESLDVANYLIRALNSNKIATYVAPSEYDVFKSDAFKAYNDMLEDTDWLNEDVTKRRNLIAKSLEDEANKLANDLSYQGKYSYEGWQDTEWDTRANATIQKLREAADTLRSSSINGLDLKLKLGQLGYGDLANYLEKEEAPVGNQSNSGSQNENQKVNQDPSKNIAFKIIEKNPFDFTAPKIIYNGTEYTYGTPEFEGIRNQVIKDDDGKPIAIGEFLKQFNDSEIDRNHIDFATVPSTYKYFKNVTQNFKRADNKSNIRAAYILSKDPLNPEGSILKVVYGNKDNERVPKYAYYEYDYNTKKAYPIGFNEDGSVYKIPGTDPRILNSIVDDIAPLSIAELSEGYSTDLIFGQENEFNVEKLDKFISNPKNVELINKDEFAIINYIGGLRKLFNATKSAPNKRRLGKITDNRRTTYYYIDFYGTNKNRPLRIYFKNQAFRDRANNENNLEAYWIQGVRLPEVKYTKSQGMQGQGPYYTQYIETYNTPLPKNKEGGILKASLGVKVSTEEPQPVKKPNKKKNTTSFSGRDMTLSSTNNYNKELEAGQDFDAGDARRLAYSLIDLGSAVGSLIPGANLASTAVGVAMTGATAVEDFADAAKGEMSYWDATKNAGISLGLDAISLLPALKAVKIGKITKTVLKTIPRLFGYAQAVNLITSEDAEALGKTFAKLGSGNLDQLNTQDFTNITQAIRIATMIGRDTKGTYKKARRLIGKKTGEVEIKGTVGDQEVVTKVNRDEITSKKLGYKYIDDAKVKQKLVKEANSNSKYTKQQVQETDADGKKLTNEDGSAKMKDVGFDIKDVKNIDRTVLRDHTFGQEVGHPKALFEGWFGYKGFDAPISDAYIARNWTPIRIVNGQATNKQVRKMARQVGMFQAPKELKTKVTEMRKKGYLNDSDAEYELRLGRALRNEAIKSISAEKGMTPEDYVKYILDNKLYDIYKQDLAAYHNSQVKPQIEYLNGKESYMRQNNRIKQVKAELSQKVTKRKEYEKLKKYAASILSKQADKTLKDALSKTSPSKRKKALEKAYQDSKSAKTEDRENKFLESLEAQFVNDEFKQGGSIERGLSLINAYKSGGLVIPKFQNEGKITLKYQYNPDVYYVDDIADYNTTTLSGNQLTDIWANKGTSSTSGNKEGIYTAKTLQNNITHQQGLDYLKNEYIANDKWVTAVQNYAQTNGVDAYNKLIDQLRSLRAEFEGEKHQYKDKNVAKYNELFNSVFGSDYHAYSDKLKDIYGQATNLRHVLSFQNTNEKKDKRQFTINGTKYWLDNAGYLRTGEYGKQYVSNQDASTLETPKTGNPSDVNKDKTGTNPEAGGGKTGTGSSKQYSSNLFKLKTRPNPIQLLRMAELAGALGTNAAATNELLKYRPYGQNASWRQASYYDKYPLIAATQNQNGSFYTRLGNPTTADLGSYLASLQAGYSKGLTAMQNAYNENYNTFLTSKAGVQEAANYNNAAEVEAGNNNVARAVTAENMKDKVRADLYSTNFAQGIKPFLSETRQYMQDAEKLRQKSEYDVQSAIAKQKYDNDIAAINENYVSSIDKDFLKANEGKSDAAIIQAWLNAHPDKAKEYKALLETPTMDYYKNQAKLYEILAPNIGFLNTSTLAYNFESGGKLTAKDKMKIQKVKDYNAARRQDSKESLKSITKDKEEFGKNYRAMSAGTLKMLERTLK